MKRPPGDRPDPRTDRRRRGRETLTRALAPLGLRLSVRTLDRCLDYWEFLGHSRQRLNLIARGDLEEGLLRHIGDALAGLAAGVPPGPRRLLDIGSGGGLPGIPLALAREDLTVTLLEGREKKTHWLARALHALELHRRVSVRTGRLEEQPAEWLHGFDLLTARAVAPPRRLIAWSRRALGPESRLLVWHSAEQLPEVRQAVEEEAGDVTIKLHDTLSYTFDAISFSSNISVLLRTH
ncbi:MAG: RsmG family class I SAM-dependent methyltransferase [bacterium]